MQGTVPPFTHIASHAWWLSSRTVLPYLPLFIFSLPFLTGWEYEVKRCYKKTLDVLIFSVNVPVCVCCSC
jgi:hypothetical protein